MPKNKDVKKSCRLFVDGMCFLCKNKKEKEKLREKLKKQKEKIGQYHLTKLLREG